MFGQFTVIIEETHFGAKCKFLIFRLYINGLSILSILVYLTRDIVQGFILSLHFPCALQLMFQIDDHCYKHEQLHAIYSFLSENTIYVSVPFPCLFISYRNHNYLVVHPLYFFCSKFPVVLSHFVLKFLIMLWKFMTCV